MANHLVERKSKEIFLEALDFDEEEIRRQFLDSACGTDGLLRQQVEVLLQFDKGESQGAIGRALGHLDAKHGAVDVTTFRPYPATGHVGPYKLLEVIGEGGMGLVYMAGQESPIRRRVALKLIKPGMDSAQVIARFEVERQALALMNHANIAKVLDAGRTEDGRPYFVMELVKGKPITDFSADAKLTLEQRLSLFTQVCEAVQHAHQKGVIHRDLKPSNILIELHDVKPIPKVIDFGIAKAVGQQLTERTLFTGFAQLIGTPLYMSPEQAQLSSLDVDTRSDVYSLGIILYELIVGRTPFDNQTFKEAGFDEIRRIIREDDPPRPSERITTLKAEGQTTLVDSRGRSGRDFARLIRGELDWIVMKAIEKDRARRYETPMAMAADIHRYLQGEPVSACPPSRLYRFKKSVGRHRAAYMFGTALAIVILAAGGISVWQAIRATEAARQSAQDAAIAKAVNEFVTQDLLSQADPTVTPDADVLLRTAVDRAANAVGERFYDQPAVEIAIRETLGETYLGLGQAAKAEEQFRQALALREAHTIGSPIFVADTTNNIARSLHRQERLKEAHDLYQIVLAQRRQLLGERADQTIKVQNNVLHTLAQLGEYEQAEAQLRKLYEISWDELGEDHETTIGVLQNLGYPLARLQKMDELRKIARKLHEWNRRVKGANAPETLKATINLAMTLYSVSPPEAIELLQEGYEQSTLRFGADHSKTIDMGVALANAYTAKGETELAEQQYRTLLDTMRRTDRVFGFTAAMCLNNLANILLEQDVAAAKDLYEEAADCLEETHGRDNPQTAMVRINVGECLREMGQFRESEQVLKQSLGILRAKLGDENPTVLAAKLNLATTLFDDSRTPEAVPLVGQVRAIAREKGLTKFLVDGLMLEAKIEFQKDDPNSGLRKLSEARSLANAEFGTNNGRSLEIVRQTADVFEQLGQHDEAIELWRQTLPIHEAVLGPDHADTLDVRERLSEAERRAETDR